MMSKALLKKMAGEVSVTTLGGFLVSYAEQINQEEVGEEALETIAAIEIITSEIKSRKAKKPKGEKPAEKPAPSSGIVGNLSS